MKTRTFAKILTLVLLVKVAEDMAKPPPRFDPWDAFRW